MSEIDDLRHAGFNEDEIASHFTASGEATAMKSAGFTDQEIASYVTGQKKPVSDTFLNRIKLAAEEGAKAGFGEAPMGIPADDERKMQEAGWFSTAEEEKKMPILKMIGTEGLIRQGYGAVETMFRATNAAIYAAGAMGGEAISSALGQDETQRAKARRDVANALMTTALVVGGTTPLRRPSAISPGVDEIVGHPPTAQDFTDATRSATGGRVEPVVRDKIVQAYEKGGALPAEVAADMALDPKLREEMGNPYSSELPEKYQPPLKTTPEGLTYREGEPRPFTKESERAIEAPAPPPEIPLSAEVSGSPVTFPDADHAALFDFGRKLTEGEQVNVAEQQRLFDAFDGFVTRDLTTPADMENMARKYFDQVSQEAFVGEPVQAPVAIEPEMVVDWYRERAIPPAETAVEEGAKPIKGEYEGSLSRTASWVIKNKATGEVIMETFDPKKIEALNTEKYDAVPIGEYLGSLNHRAKARAERYKQTTVSPKTKGMIDDFYAFLNDESGAVQVPLFGKSPKSAGIEAGESTKPGPGKAPYFTYDDRGTFAKAFSKAIHGYQSTFQPELVSDEAFRADPLFAQSNSRIAGMRDRVVRRGDEERQSWRPVSDEARLQYLNKVELQEPMDTPELQAKADRHRAMLDAAHRLEVEAGSKQGYIDGYFGHIWERPVEAKAILNTRIGQLGKAWFEKARDFDLISQGMEAGLRLKTTNPEDLVTMRLLASADMTERVSLLRGLKDMGLAIESKIANDQFNKARLFDREAVDSLDLDKHGWQQIKAPNGEDWKLAPDVLALWKNAVESKGFYANEGAVGSTFRGWMAFKAVWVPIKLSLSAFHPLHVLGIYNFSSFARAWSQIAKGGDFLGAMRSVAEGVVEPVSTAIPGVPTVGKGIREAWLKPVGERTPWEKAAVDLLHDGGFVPQIAEEMRINATRGFQDALDKGQWLKLVPNTFRRGIELLQAPIFEKWIPNLRASAYFRDATALLERRPDLLDNAELRRTALRTIAKSVDNRFGQMFYKNLFWNRYVKDAGIGSFLSLGWNLGFAREFGGALVDPIARGVERAVKGAPSEAKLVARDAQNKLPFVISYVGGNMLIMGMLTYLFTGTSPNQLLDYFLPRVGGKNPDGSDRRVTNMTYLREIPMFVKHTQERGGNIVAGAAAMLYNKMMFEPIVELLKNRDYYGANIWDENSPFYKQAWQGIKQTFGEQFNPIAVTGAKRARQTGGDWWESGLAFLGMGPAPAYAEKTATQNRIQYLFMEHVAPSERTQVQGEQAKDRGDIRNELLAAKKTGDSNALRAAAMKWFAAGGSRTGMANMLLGIGSDVGMFKSLPEDDQKAVLHNATPEEFKKFNPYLKTHTARDVADLIVQAQIARASGNEIGAAGIDAKVKQTIQAAIKDGRINDAAAFQRSVGQEIIARRAPDLAAILTQPKRMRKQYMPQLQR